LSALGADDLVFEELEAGIEMVAKVLGRVGVARNVIAERVHEARVATQASARGEVFPRRRLHEQPVLSGLKVESFELREGDYAVGRSVVGLDLRRRTGALLVAVSRKGGLLEQVGGEVKFEVGDLLFLVGSARAVEEAFGVLERGVERESCSS